MGGRSRSRSTQRRSCKNVNHNTSAPILIYILLRRRLVSVTQMSSVRQVQAHQPVMWSHNGLVNLQVCWTPAQRLDIDTPLLRVEVERFQRSCLTCEFHRINMLVASVVSCSRVPFGVLV